MKQFYFLFVLSSFFSINAQNIGLDTTFGNNGVVILPGYSQNDIPMKVLFENDKYYLISPSNIITSINFNGSINTTFGVAGKLTLNSDNLNENYIIKGAKLIDGYIYVFGQKTSTSTSNKDGFVIKANLSGIYDSNFGVNGKAVFNFAENEEEFNDIIINEFNEIFVAGTRASKLILAKLNSSGTLNNSFDSNGYKMYPLSSTEYYKIVNLFYNNGELFFIGCSSGGAYKNLILFKVDINGNPISSFGTAGLRTVQLSGTGELSSYIIEKSFINSNNELYFLCYWSYSFISQEKRLYKYNLNTNLLNQVTYLPLYNSHFELNADSKIYTTGTYGCSPATSSTCSRNFQIFKKNADGTLDMSFNSTGTFSYNFFPSDLYSDDKTSYFYLHNDGKVLLAGYVYNPYTTNGTGIGLVRLTESSLGFDQEQIKSNQVIIYPNPAKNIISIKNENDGLIEKIIIYNISGQKILEQNTSESDINIEKIQSGFYFLEFQQKGLKYKSTFIKN